MKDDTPERILALTRKRFAVSIKHLEAGMLEGEALMLEFAPEIGPDLRKAREALRNAVSKLDTA